MTGELKALGEMIKGDAKLSSRVVIAKVRFGCTRRHISSAATVRLHDD